MLDHDLGHVLFFDLLLNGVKIFVQNAQKASILFPLIPITCHQNLHSFLLLRMLSFLEGSFASWLASVVREQIAWLFEMDLRFVCFNLVKGTGVHRWTKSTMIRICFTVQAGEGG